MIPRVPTFELVPLDSLLIHEEIETGPLGALLAQIRRDGTVRDPIWVAYDSRVVLNGHHRLAALRTLGVVRAPVWLLDYEDPRIQLDRWSPGPPLTKAEIIARARAGRPFPPKTTRHRLAFDLPDHPTALAVLGEATVARAMKRPSSAPVRP